MCAAGVLALYGACPADKWGQVFRRAGVRASARHESCTCTAERTRPVPHGRRTSMTSALQLTSYMAAPCSPHNGWKQHMPHLLWQGARRGHKPWLCLKVGVNEHVLVQGVTNGGVVGPRACGVRRARRAWDVAAHMGMRRVGLRVSVRLQASQCACTRMQCMHAGACTCCRTHAHTHVLTPANMCAA